MAKQYRLRKNDAGEVEECFCCGYAAPLAKFEDRNTTGEPNWFCEVCGSTFLSLAVTRPVEYRDDSLYRSIGWIANKILDEIRALKDRQ